MHIIRIYYTAAITIHYVDTLHYPTVEYLCHNQPGCVGMKLGVTARVRTHINIPRRSVQSMAYTHMPYQAS